MVIKLIESELSWLIAKIRQILKLKVKAYNSNTVQNVNFEIFI